jgi:hypothetical protein
VAGTVTVTVNRRGIEEILHGNGPGGHVHRYLGAKGRQVERLARRKAPKKSGKLAASIKAGPFIDTPRRVRINISVGVYYGIWQEKGTGVYAGKGPIRAKNSKYMRFKPDNALDAAGNVRLDRRGNRIGRRAGRGPSSGRGGYVYAKQVKGTPAKHFMRDALLEVCMEDPRLKARLVAR